MYGADDFDLGQEVGLPKHHLVKLDGTFVEGMDFLTGRFVADEEVAVDIIKDLAHRGLLFAKAKYEHSYPHCWRCKTKVIYYAKDSWYIRMSELRDELLAQNANIHWEPDHIRDGRFGGVVTRGEGLGVFARALLGNASAGVGVFFVRAQDVHREF